jgi:hypothetical protein
MFISIKKKRANLSKDYYNLWLNCYSEDVGFEPT